ncbi:MAG: hypothetical protein OXC60_03635 [Litoreibacter sp.]|nr:hypothetical protein [Litoreibacter sp.]MCY4333748.1 hypothetical protein [Litoreibacter sp.]
MSSYRTEVQNLRYNAATQSFEALILFYEGGDVLKYPTELALPIQSDFSFVSKKLVSEAKRQRRQNAGHLISRTACGDARLAHLGDLARQMTRSLGLKTPRAA